MRVYWALDGMVKAIDAGGGTPPILDPQGGCQSIQKVAVSGGEPGGIMMRAAAVCIIAAVALVACSSRQLDGVMTGAAGAGGGTVGAGGTGDVPATGKGGEAGEGTNPSLACSATAAVTATVTGFEDVTGTNPIRFGSGPLPTGHTFARIATGTGVPPMLSIVPSGNGTNALQVVSPAGNSGFFDAGLAFDATLDAQAASHVRFTIHFLANCSTGFAVMSPQGVKPADDPRGICTTSSLCPLPFTNISQEGVLCAPVAGYPASAGDPASVIGLVWRSGGGCSFTIDDVAFVKE